MRSLRKGLVCLSLLDVNIVMPIKASQPNPNGGTLVAGKKHPGFASVQSKIAKEEGVSKDRAGAILASATRKASPAAKRANPALKKVKGK